MDKNYDKLLNEIKSLAEYGNTLAKQAIAIYEPLVDNIIKSQITDANQIEHLLDYLLGFCYHKDALTLYRKLCRHYYFINPEATARYVTYYQEMWDEDKTQFGKRE